MTTTITSPQRLGPAATLVICNARIWSGVADQSRKVPLNDKDTAIAVAGNRIIAVGSDEEIAPLVDAETKVIDAGGRQVIPGMTDSHTHIIGGGLQMARLNLRAAKNREEFVRAIEVEALSSKRKNTWVLGGRWSVESWPNKEQPTKAWIDAVTGEVPVFLNRMDGHEALVNSAALRLAGIDVNGPPDPLGGEIERDPRTKEPTGILKESAMDLVEKLIPPPSFQDRYEALQRAMKHANSLGITSVHDMSDLDYLDVFAVAHRDHAQTVRITSYLSVSNWTEHYDTVDHYPIRDDLLRVVGFKGYMDGSLGSRTAFMHEPYADATSDAKFPRGQLTAMADPIGKFAEGIYQARKSGFQLAIHAIGDEANHFALNSYGRFPDSMLFRTNTYWDCPRIEHAQHLLEQDIPLFGKHSFVASMQPYHKADDGRYAEKALGKERLKGSYAYRQLVDSGAVVIFGSDWPVVTMNPWEGIDSAVNARLLDESGKLHGDVWLPEHSLTLEEAMLAYTTWPPRVVGQWWDLGAIRERYLADIVILNEDPFAIPVAKVGDVTVWKTIFDGRIVYEKQ